MTHGVLVSPLSYSGRDHLGRSIAVSVPFNNSTKAITGSMTITRDAGCAFDRVVIGRAGAARRVYMVTGTSAAVPAAQLSTDGFSTITLLANAGVTLGITET